jgi:hypothetical protein
MKNSKKGLRLIAWILGIIAGFVIIVFVAGSLLIGWSVNDNSKKAMAQFGGDRAEALIAQVDCETCSLDDRNHAVWTLGQLADKRALPVLYKYYTGKRCNHMREICQYELSKAIKWTEGNSFMLPQMWRPFL